MKDDRTYIKLFHQMLDWGWYGDTNTFRVFMHILLRANYQESEYLGHKIGAGECVFGRKSWAEELGLSERQIRTAIEHLQSTNEIMVRATNRFSIITVVKWEFWQIEEGLSDQQATSGYGEDSVKTKKIDQQATNKEIAESLEILTRNGYRVSKGGKQATSKRPTSDQQATTSKEYKNIYTTTPTIYDVRSYVKENGLLIDPDFFFKYYETAGWVDKNGKRVKNWKLKALNWNKREVERHDANRSGKQFSGLAGGLSGGEEQVQPIKDWLPGEE